jgi:hypothetical protein
MSTTSPFFDTWSSSDDGPLSPSSASASSASASSATDAASLPAFADLPAFQPRRSVLVSWPVRVAQAADRMVARALAPGAPGGATGRAWTTFTLAGLDRWCRLLPSHPEALLAERARLRIEQLMEERVDRLARFLELRHAMETAGQAGQEWQADSSRQIHLNPANCWTRWDPAVGLDDESLSSSILFFLVGQELRGIRMRLEGQVLINELADYQPCTIAQWAQLSALVDAAQLAVLVRHLAEMGLVAYE